jgi:hypothetical protein
MSYNLKNFVFGNASDTLTKAGEGIFLSGYNIVDTGGGNDIIEASGKDGELGAHGSPASPEVGILLSPELPILKMSNGSDRLIGHGGNGDSVPDPQFDSGDGQDGAAGIKNNGVIDMGTGKGSPEYISGTGGDGGDGGQSGTFEDGDGGNGGIGIDNEGTILTGNAADQIIGTGGTGGLPGDPFIAGAGSDGNGISNAGTGKIATYGGDDIITGVSTGVPAISNNGIIDMGKGNDQLIGTNDDATASDANVEFIGQGYYYLGSGSDVVSGFGSGKFDGGSGNDALLIDPTEYLEFTQFTLSSNVNSNGFYELSGPGGYKMELIGFETINGTPFGQLIGETFTFS